MKRILLSIGLSALMVGCGSSDEVATTEKVESETLKVDNVEQTASVRDSISDSVYAPYNPDNDRKAIQQFGSRMDDIQALREQFAEQAITSGKCEKVTMSEVKLDSPLDSPEFFIACWDGSKEEQIYSNEADIKASAPLLSKDEKGLSDSDATKICIKNIKDNTKEFSNVKINYIADQTFVKMADGSSEVKIGFDVTNALNAEVPYLASCKFDIDGNETDFTITQGKR